MPIMSADGFPSSPGLYATAAANTDVVLTLTAHTNQRWLVAAIHCSYSAVPTAGRISIESPTATYHFDLDYGTQLLPLHMHFGHHGRWFGENTEVVITLHAAGVGVIGKLNVDAYLV